MYQRLIFRSQLPTWLYRFVAVIKHVRVRRSAQCKLGLRARLPLRKTPEGSLNVTIRHLKWPLFGCPRGGNTGMVFAPGRENRQGQKRLRNAEQVDQNVGLWCNTVMRSLRSLHTSLPNASTAGLGFSYAACDVSDSDKVCSWSSRRVFASTRER